MPILACALLTAACACGNASLTTQPSPRSIPRTSGLNAFSAWYAAYIMIQ
jgi:hypothetical protein